MTIHIARNVTLNLSPTTGEICHNYALTEDSKFYASAVIGNFELASELASLCKSRLLTLVNAIHSKLPYIPIETHVGDYAISTWIGGGGAGEG